MSTYCVDGLSHYEVNSPSYDVRGLWLSRTFCYGLYLVANSSAAMSAFEADPQSAPWLEIAKDEGHSAFQGLNVNLAQCSHGVCWACEYPEVVLAEYWAGYPCYPCSDDLMREVDLYVRPA